MNRSTTAALLAAGAALMLSACGGSKPGGQVAATVDGDEITMTELNQELQGVQVPKDADKKLLQRQALQRIIDRKLIANAAREDNLDQTPEFVVRRQQLEDGLLAQMLTQKVARGLTMPTATDISKFEADNPNMFANRTVYTLDQIRFPTPTNETYLKELAAAKTMPAVIAVLDKNQIKYQRGAGQLDSAVVPKAMLEQIKKVPPGEPFVVPAGNVVIVSLITGSNAAPLPADAVRPIAVNAARQAKLGEQLQARLKAEKAKAKIEYQPGFAPPPGNGAAGTPAAPAS